MPVKGINGLGVLYPWVLIKNLAVKQHVIRDDPAPGLDSAKLTRNSQYNLLYRYLNTKSQSSWFWGSTCRASPTWRLILPANAERWKKKPGHDRHLLPLHSIVWNKPVFCQAFCEAECAEPGKCADIQYPPRFYHSAENERNKPCTDPLCICALGWWERVNVSFSIRRADKGLENIST